MTRRLDEETGERVVHFGGLDAGESKSYLRYGLDEVLN
jgi:hypothetical protein